MARSTPCRGSRALFVHGPGPNVVDVFLSGRVRNPDASGTSSESVHNLRNLNSPLALGLNAALLP